MMLLPGNADMTLEKALPALSLSSPQGTRVFASGNSGWKTPELHRETSKTRFLLLVRYWRCDASRV